MNVTFFIVVIALIAAGLGTYVYLSSRQKRESAQFVPAPARPAVKLKPVVEGSVVTRSAPPPVPPVVPASPLFDLDLEPGFVAAPPPVEIRWSNQFDPRSGTLDEMSRLRLIGDLGVVGKEWCVPLLSAAYEEERRPGHRQAALIALTACHSRAAAATFRNAMQSADPSERAIAADGLADLEPPPSPPRRTVERR